MFVFPYAGGVAASFAPWRDLAAPELSVQVALMPGRGARLHEPPVDDLAELVDALATAVAERASGPFLLFGHSLGALVAFEVTRELRRRARPRPWRCWSAAPRRREPGWYGGVSTTSTTPV
ncbi:thioesterase domain-containing protein [Micromonospora sp. BRA006-A]|nr:thioesterase domain-containing protein [Micromonospora sp. BRA006-A]